MKKLLPFFCMLFIGNIGFTQVSDIVQQTWYLRNVHLDNTTHYVPYGETIQLSFGGNNPDYSINTNGIENTFTANANFNNTAVTFSNIEVSSSDCTDPNCYFEDLYFYQLLSNHILDDKTFTYFYMVFSSGRKSFRLTDSSGNIAYFTDQPIPEIDPALFQTWYLHAMDYDLGGMDYIGSFDPPIAPTLTINPDLTFTGFGSCNEFSGNFDYTEVPNSGELLFPKNFDSTNDTCQFHTDFEDYYFSQFEYDYPLYFEFWEDPNNGEAYFSFEVMAGFNFYFYNYPVLSIPDLEKNSFLIYPNPANDRLFIKSSLNNLQSATITDINGRIVAKKISVSNEIDVSNLKSGMYFITITSSEGIITKKFIKN
ncbi:MAG: T9SS type A sorting domain-containing protein [Aequorivita sp.]|nr:T9SS type A sorting domain-containing protein [Aequorivita sp.]